MDGLLQFLIDCNERKLSWFKLALAVFSVVSTALTALIYLLEPGRIESAARSQGAGAKSTTAASSRCRSFPKPSDHIVMACHDQVGSRA